MTEGTRGHLATARDALKQELTDDHRALAKALNLVELATLLDANGKEITRYCLHALGTLASIEERRASRPTQPETELLVHVRAASDALRKIAEPGLLAVTWPKLERRGDDDRTEAPCSTHWLPSTDRLRMDRPS